MRTLSKLTAIAGALLFAVACAKGPAQEALKAAQSKVDAAKPEAEKYAADALRSVSDTLKSAQDKFNAGDYAGALAAAKEIPGKVDQMKAAIEAKKAELAKSWSGMQAELPGMVSAADAKLKELGGMKKLPAGMDAAKLEGAKADFAKLGALWNEATAAAGAGDLMVATAKAGEAKGVASGLLATLGIAAPAPAADSAPAAKA